MPVRTRVALAIVLSLALTACSRPAPPSDAVAVRIADVNLGRTLNADKTIGDNTTSFRPADTVYASVVTEGSRRVPR